MAVRQRVLDILSYTRTLYATVHALLAVVQPTLVIMGRGHALAHALQTYSSPVHFLGGFVIGTVPFKQMLHIAYLPCAPLRSVGAALPLRCTAARYGLTVTAAIL